MGQPDTPEDAIDAAIATEQREFADASDPFHLFEAWMAEATKSEINDPNGMALATVDPSGLPNVRMVLLKGVDEPGHPERGFVFFTNLESAKGQELAGQPQAALLFHWKSLRRQVRVRGRVVKVGDGEADAYFATRARGSRLGAWASAQSRPLESRMALGQAIAKTVARFPFGAIPRPPHWSGFRVVPVEIELWADRPFRLHDRLVFRRADACAPWTQTRLYP